MANFDIQNIAQKKTFIHKIQRQEQLKLLFWIAVSGTKLLIIQKEKTTAKIEMSPQIKQFESMTNI